MRTGRSMKWRNKLDRLFREFFLEAVCLFSERIQFFPVFKTIAVIVPNNNDNNKPLFNDDDDVTLPINEQQPKTTNNIIANERRSSDK